MGRKGNNKSSIKKDVIKEIPTKSLPAKKRNEVTQLVDKLLRISTIPSPQILPKMVKLQDEIDEVITKIINIEASIDVPAGNRASTATVDKFVNWMRENGGKFDGISIEQYPGYELGLKTDRDISEGSLIISVPRKVMMTTEAAQKSLMGSLLEKDTMLQNMPNIALAMFLLVEKFSPNSFWKPYIDILPTSYTTVLYFTKEELMAFRESPTFVSALNLIKSIVRQYSYLNKLIQSADHPAAELLRNVFTFQQYRWAVSTIMTRLNNVPASDDSSHMINALIPLWDLCNHTNGNISTNYNPEQQTSECLAVKDFKKGEQLFIFYGARSNAELFIHNGFVYEENEHDGYWLKLGLSKSDPLYEKRSALLNKITVAAHGEFWIHPGAEPITGQLLGFMRVFNMSEEQLDHWLASEKSMDLLYKDCALETDLENKTWVFLQTRLKLILATYKNPIEDDEKLVKNAKVSQCKKLAIQMRLSEKRILQGAVTYVEQRIKS